MKSSEKNKLTTRLPDYTQNKGGKVKPRKNLPPIIRILHFL